MPLYYRKPIGNSRPWGYHVLELSDLEELPRSFPSFLGYMTLPQAEFVVTSSCVKPWGTGLRLWVPYVFQLSLEDCNNHVESHIDSCSEPFWTGFRIWWFYLHKYRWYYDTMTVSKSIEKTVFSPSSLILPSIARFEICFLNWSIVDLQWCVSFKHTSKVTQFYICIYTFTHSVIHTYIYFFQILFYYWLLWDIQHSSMCYTVGPCCFVYM